MRIYEKIEVCVMKKLDKVDKKIIQILQKNARTPLKEIAAQVFLSSPSVSARIEKLEHEGVIIGYTARVNRSISITILRLSSIWRWSHCRSRYFIRSLKKFQMWWSAIV